MLIVMFVRTLLSYMLQSFCLFFKHIFNNKVKPKYFTANRKSMVISEEQRELLLKPFNEG